MVVGLFIVGGVLVVFRVFRFLREEIGFRGVLGLWGEREIVRGLVDGKGRIGMGMFIIVRMFGFMGEKMGFGGILGLFGGRETVGVFMVVGLRIVTEVFGLSREEIVFGGFLGLSRRK